MGAPGNEARLMRAESPTGDNPFAVTGRLLVEGRLVDGAVLVEGERIVEVRTDGAGALPARRIATDIVSPGLVDLQVNGAFGVEVGADPEALRALAARLPATGVTAFLPTVVSAGAAHYGAVAAAFAAARGTPGARMPGLHLEGPLLSAARAGVHARAAIAGGDATWDGAIAPLLARGDVRLVTLAPERPGALARIAALRAAGVAVALGHSDASFDQTIAGLDAGATLVTHLYSAMSGFHHRAPGAVGAALTDERAIVALIADGVHAHPAALNLALRAKGADRIVLVTDAVAAAGQPPGRYTLAGQTIVSDGQAVRDAGGTLAGSALTMDRAVRAMVALGGARLEDALAMASTIPAAAIGLADTGRLAPGLRADLTLWSTNVEVTATIVGGALAFSN
jgi:N-acetylglucosamine-6-phosphate deacetylase